ncbi:sialin-like [Tribolium madens]|uniref:sialin-like n=1 Tax=Tribolium madens TaxID=41895 RepID=UPI001CF751CC|nr:sialin-like [Tribolium madens]
MQFNINLILNELPSYMNQILHFNIKENGLLSSIPFFVSYFVAVVSAYVADKWKKSERFSALTIRRMCTSISFCIPIIFYLIQIVWGNSKNVSVIVFTLSLGFTSVATAGFLSNSIDISPTYSGTILGLGVTGGAATGYISAKIVAFITDKNATFEQWRYIFWLLIGINLVGSIIYCIFSSVSIQKWNLRNNIEEPKNKKVSSEIINRKS